MKSVIWNPGKVLDFGEETKSCAVAEFIVWLSRVSVLRFLLFWRNSVNADARS